MGVYLRCKKNGEINRREKGEKTINNFNKMNSEVRTSIDSYVILLPDTFHKSPNDNSRLVEIAYYCEKDNAGFDDEFRDYFIHKLSEKFKEFSMELIEDFYGYAKEKIEKYSYVVYELK